MRSQNGEGKGGDAVACDSLNVNHSLIPGSGVARGVQKVPQILLLLLP